MRRVWFAAALVAFGCNDNWSNTDIEYGTALPRRVQLEVIGQYAVTFDAGSAGIATGGQSLAAATVTSAAANYNALFDYLFGAFDVLGTLVPSRTDTSRTWGPYDDSYRAGLSWSIVANKAGTTAAPLFNWTITGTLTSANFSAGTGTFIPSPTVDVGSGTASFPVGNYPASLTDAGILSSVRSVAVTYAKRAPTGVSVNAQITFADQPVTQLSASGYTYVLNADSSVVFGFSPRGDYQGKSNVTIRAGWTSSGQGIAVATEQTAGGAPGTVIVDCWDATYIVNWHTEDGGVGGACPVVTGL